MNKLTYLFIILFVTQSFCQEETNVPVSSELDLETISSFDPSMLEGIWDIQAIFTMDVNFQPRDLYFRPINIKVLDRSSIEVTDAFINISSNETQEESMRLTNDEENQAIFYFDPARKEETLKVVLHEKILDLMFPEQSLEVGESGETGEIEEDIPLETIEQMEGGNEEMINIEGILEPEDLEGEVLIVEVHQGENHFLVALTRRFDGVYDLRRFLREHRIKYEINRDYFQYPIVQKFEYQLLENFSEPQLDGEWHLLGVYEIEDHGRLVPWELGYCPEVSVDMNENGSIEIDLDLKLLLGGDFSRSWTVFPRGDEMGVVIGFVGDRPIPIGVIDMNDNGLLVAITNEGAAFLIATPSWTGQDLTQEDINYFRGILNDNLKEELSDFWLYFFFKDECMASDEDQD